MKRVIACLLAFYTILLSGIPCQDEIPSFIRDTNQILASTTDQHAGADADLCSPLCICACCAGVTLPELFTPFSSTETEEWAQKPLFSYHSLVKDDSHPAVWQPPRTLA